MIRFHRRKLLRPLAAEHNQILLFTTEAIVGDDITLHTKPKNNFEHVLNSAFSNITVDKMSTIFAGWPDNSAERWLSEQHSNFNLKFKSHFELERFIDIIQVWVYATLPEDEESYLDDYYSVLLLSKLETGV